MYDLILKNISRFITLTPEEEQYFTSLLKVKKLKKKQYLLQEGDVCRFIAFVEKGALRSYSVDEKGAERIVQFAIEGWTISDLFSFLTAEPATYNIDAIEDSELVLISLASHEKLLQLLPKYETWIRIQITGAYIAMQRRLTSIISLTLEERYAAFIALYPQIVQRVPQHMIAAYMGLTPETLSRVRSKMSRR